MTQVNVKLSLPFVCELPADGETEISFEMKLPARVEGLAFLSLTDGVHLASLVSDDVEQVLGGALIPIRFLEMPGGGFGADGIECRSKLALRLKNVLSWALKVSGELVVRI